MRLQRCVRERLRRLRLQNLTDTDKKQQNKLKKTALEVALQYLANRMRTVHEMSQHLKDKGFPDKEIEEAVSDLIGLRYLDDYAYALRYYEYNTAKHRGSKRAMRELEEKGVDKETIKFALEDYLYESAVDELKMALEIAARESEDKEIDDKLIAKVARKLDSRGYAQGDIIKVMSEMRRWDNSKLN